jgi:hypothetical protein
MCQLLPSRWKVLKVDHPLDKNFDAAPEAFRSTKIATFGASQGGINANSFKLAHFVVRFR